MFAGVEQSPRYSVRLEKKAPTTKRQEAEQGAVCEHLCPKFVMSVRAWGLLPGRAARCHAGAERGEGNLSELVCTPVRDTLDATQLMGKEYVAYGAVWVSNIRRECL